MLASVTMCNDKISK